MYVLILKHRLVYYLEFSLNLIADIKRFKFSDFDYYIKNI